MNTGLLTAARTNLLKEAVASFKADPAVTALFLGGSIPAGTADEWSDIDLRVVVAPEAHTRFVSTRLDTPKHWKGFLFNEWMEGTQHCVSHFRPFLKIDIFYYSESDLAPSPWLRLPIEILYDPKGVVADLIARSEPFTFKADAAGIDWLLSKGLAAAHEAYRRTKRGELLYAQALLEELRSHIVQADDAIRQWVPNATGDLKLERRLPPQLLDALRESYVTMDAPAMEAALLKLLGHFREQVLRLHEMYQPPRPLENDLHAVDVLGARNTEPGFSLRNSHL